jgi:uncharacterized protein YggE
MRKPPKFAALAPLALCALCATAFADDGAPRSLAPTVVAVGEATEEVKPDVAFIGFGVAVERPTPDEAAAEDANAAAAVIAALKAQGIDDKDLKTAALSLAPVTTATRDPKTGAVLKTAITGYRAYESVRARVRAIDKLGAIVAAVVKGGATDYQGLDFDLSDREAREDALRVKATQAAARRAALYAEGAGVKLGGVASIVPQAERPRPTFDVAARALVGSGAAAPVEPGLITLSESVTVTYALTGP